MSRAGLLHALVEIGPRPPWWRPLKRRAWNDVRTELLEKLDALDPAPPSTIQ